MLHGTILQRMCLIVSGITNSANNRPGRPVVPIAPEQIMTEFLNPKEQMLVAVVDDMHLTDTPQGRAIRRIMDGIRQFGIRVGDVSSPNDARAAYSALAEIDCILINWNVGGGSPKSMPRQQRLIREIRERNEKVPIFLLGEPTNAAPTT